MIDTASKGLGRTTQRAILVIRCCNPQNRGETAGLVEFSGAIRAWPGAMQHAVVLARVLKRTVEHGLEQEIAFLFGFVLARRKLDTMLDWPAHSLELFVGVVHQNSGTLSPAKRQSYFTGMTDEEVARCETIVGEAFAHCGGCP